MIVRDLLSDANGRLDGKVRLLLATRTVDGNLLPPGKVEVTDTGRLQIDDSAQEIDLLPARFVDSPTPACLTVEDVRAAVEKQPALADYALTGVVGYKRLEDGGNVQSTHPVIGLYVPPEDREAWLLLYPQEQWPEKWFGST